MSRWNSKLNDLQNLDKLWRVSEVFNLFGWILPSSKGALNRSEIILNILASMEEVLISLKLIWKGRAKSYANIK